MHRFETLKFVMFFPDITQLSFLKSNSLDKVIFIAQNITPLSKYIKARIWSYLELVPRYPSLDEEKRSLPLYSVDLFRLKNHPYLHF